MATNRRHRVAAARHCAWLNKPVAANEKVLHAVPFFVFIAREVLAIQRCHAPDWILSRSGVSHGETKGSACRAFKQGIVGLYVQIVDDALGRFAAFGNRRYYQI